ncbi:hypothetical protein [uncultured Ruegeria sp.]|uniref:hypothetical protein n=1 Tax=uncultured Ruegeria sp. TaxID=259304 RepID=UPI00263727C2|nr:hypothetical protein [uncultured Ruegeria sp.]
MIRVCISRLRRWLPVSGRTLRRIPRKSRRGSLMIGATLALLIGTVSLSLVMQGELRKVQLARNLARAQQIAEIASLFDLYINEIEDESLSWDDASPQRGFQIGESGASYFESWADGVVSWDVAGFDLSYFVLDLYEGSSSQPDKYGLLLLSANEDAAYADLDGLLDALEGMGLNSGRKDDHLVDRLLPAVDRAEDILGRKLKDNETAILTASLSGVPEDYVLRDERAGHPVPGFADGDGAFDLGGNDISGMGSSTADFATIGTVTGGVEAERHTGSLEAVSGSLALDEGITASSLQVTTTLGLGLAGATELQVGQAAVSSVVSAGTFSVTAGPLQATDMFGDAVTVEGDMIGVNEVIASDVLADDGVHAGTADLTTLTAVRATIQQLTVSGSCDGC